jgi:hypothetical protein
MPGAALAVAALLAVHGAGCRTRPAAAGDGADDAGDPGGDAGSAAACVDGAVETMICDALGTQSRRCERGKWSDDGPCDAPPALVIPVPEPVDVVHDARRHRLYITSRDLDGLVLSYDLPNRRFDPPLLSGGAFLGIDLSPDGDHLVVADNATDAGQIWIYRIDLTTGATHKLAFARTPDEAGTIEAVFTTDGEALVTSDAAIGADVPLRRVDLTTGAAVNLLTTRGSAGLGASADHAVIGFVELDPSGRQWGRYQVADQTITTPVTDTSGPRIAVDRTGSQFAIPRGRDLALFDAKLRLRAAIAAPFPAMPISAAYSSMADELYVAWSGATTSIDAWSSVTLDKLRDIVPAAGLFPDLVFGPGPLRVSADGRLVFSITRAGVGVYRAGP